MTTSSNANLNADRLIAGWLAADRGSLEAERLDGALAAARTLRQRRGLRAMLVGSGSWPVHRTVRLSKLPPGLRIAIALVLTTAVAAGGLLLAGTLVPDPPAEVAPAGLAGSWKAPMPPDFSFGSPSGPKVLTLVLPEVGGRAVADDGFSQARVPSTLDAATSTGLTFSALPHVASGRGDDGTVFRGDEPLAACSAGEVGRYRWALSGDGTELTLNAIADPCEARAFVLERTWLGAFGATSRGGTAVVPGFVELLRLTLPEGEYEVTSLPSLFVARGTLPGGLPLTVFVLRNARDEREATCSGAWAPGDVIGLGRERVDAFARRRPMLVGAFPDERDDRVIGGYDAIHLGIYRGCADDATVVWGPGDDPAYRIGQPDGQAASLWFIDRGGDLWVVGTLESTAPATYPDSNRKGEVLDSIEWLSNPPDEVPS